MRKCTICGKEVTESQLRHAEAFKTGAKQYTHTDCIDDQSRQEDDAYYRIVPRK